MDLEKNLDLERIRNGELMAALERESDEAKSLTQTLDKERQHTREEIASQVSEKVFLSVYLSVYQNYFVF